jgi:hypothetical protein
MLGAKLNYFQLARDNKQSYSIDIGLARDSVVKKCSDLGLVIADIREVIRDDLHVFNIQVNGVTKQNELRLMKLIGKCAKEYGFDYRFRFPSFCENCQ